MLFAKAHFGMSCSWAWSVSDTASNALHATLPAKSAPAGLIAESLPHGMQGEPLNNYPAVKAAVSMLTDGRIFGLRRQKVTISTVGVVPRVLQVRIPPLTSSSCLIV